MQGKKREEAEVAYSGCLDLEDNPEEWIR